MESKRKKFNLSFRNNYNGNGNHFSHESFQFSYLKKKYISLNMASIKVVSLDFSKKLLFLVQKIKKIVHQYLGQCQCNFSINNIFKKNQI